MPSVGTAYCVKLASRASMCILPPNEDYRGNVYVDINNVAGPNVAGKDLFLFYIYRDGFVGEKYDNSDLCSDGTYGIGCFKKVVNAGWVIDY